MVEAGCLVGGDVLAGGLRIGIGSMEGIMCMIEKKKKKWCVGGTWPWDMIGMDVYTGLDWLLLKFAIWGHGAVTEGGLISI